MSTTELTIFPRVWRSLIYFNVLALIVLVCLGLFSCSRVLTPATEVMYQGNLEGDYKSSEDVLAQVLAVRDCMGLKERSFPLPQIVGMSGGNGVQCGDQVKMGCYTPGTIIVPNDTGMEIIAHEAVHHYLFLSTGDMDTAHKSDYFLKCGGSIKAE